jgi:hypothetical protein
MTQGATEFLDHASLDEEIGEGADPGGHQTQMRKQGHGPRSRAVRSLAARESGGRREM